MDATECASNKLVPVTNKLTALISDVRKKKCNHGLERPLKGEKRIGWQQLHTEKTLN